MTKKKVKYPKLWKRAVAYFIDLFIVNLIVVLPFREFLEVKQAQLGLTSQVFVIGLIMSVLIVLYWAILEYLTTQSIGKMLMKIYVRSTTKKLIFWQCFVRNVTKVSTFVLLIDCLYMFAKKTHQRYFETISRTEVTE